MSETPQIWYQFRDVLYAGEFEVAEKLLAETPALVHLADSLGETVLHFLALENDMEAVAWLHAKGADIDTKNKFGTPVVFEVAQLGYKELFAWFAARGADLQEYSQTTMGRSNATLECCMLGRPRHFTSDSKATSPIPTRFCCCPHDREGSVYPLRYVTPARCCSSSNFSRGIVHSVIRTPVSGYGGTNAMSVAHWKSSSSATYNLRSTLMAGRCCREDA
ncbi:ankyrin repeat domain-containing protein [Massilia horti]|uniref:Ankyrin repeat protein n=1 Tax=Massilia horti TaxID=2562153 RepID=A0A4Y9T415_9BURK|nr:ankyrin repeat protein [Massilia horti]